MCNKWLFRVCALFLLVFGLICTPNISFAQPSGKLVIFHAGSLSVPFAAMEKAFEAKYPEVDVQRQAGGSTKLARLISEVGQKADIMASADYVVINKNLIPKYASWNVRFASNQMVLCYTDKSKFADTISSKNWYKVLQNKDVVWGHSDPNLDPCGYRACMVLQLAEKFYGVKGLNDKLVANRPAKNVRPKSVELISLLQSGHMDYAWEYRSVAVQHGLKFITLDPHMNLGDYKLTSFYKNAVVKVTGKKPGTFINRKGKSITYGITMLDGAKNKEAAELFLAFMLSPEGGMQVLKDKGQPPFIPARTTAEGMNDVPLSLRKFVEVRD
ncbi:tungstate ABC transporter substrate-binding protein WtpA [Halodesulfovibrio sp. MK-HDV]|jgi:molybdate/tungstate transport system substrate-binding protein|uniref:tungstate ABC transporter substrate-binding protein WtpA n=1 Tax=Halodesulfovibrio sp. MK-HDV TaxID=2599925 RepID=UPI00136B3313|nr:tungstate ABC transporter substrate-binding protein WtpA [Halodesulfovibrio sp. MK-HDV]KAF1077823.1 hypothetical protein MKHDV_00283 [Halodesulfovibrio sp. MK-HDV]